MRSKLWLSKSDDLNDEHINQIVQELMNQSCILKHLDIDSTYTAVILNALKYNKSVQTLRISGKLKEDDKIMQPNYFTDINMKNNELFEESHSHDMQNDMVQNTTLKAIEIDVNNYHFTSEFTNCLGAQLEAFTELSQLRIRGTPFRNVESVGYFLNRIKNHTKLDVLDMMDIYVTNSEDLFAKFIKETKAQHFGEISFDFYLCSYRCNCPILKAYKQNSKLVIEFLQLGSHDRWYSIYDQREAILTWIQATKGKNIIGENTLNLPGFKIQARSIKPINEYDSDYITMNGYGGKSIYIILKENYTEAYRSEGLQNMIKEVTFNSLKARQ